MPFVVKRDDVGVLEELVCEVLEFVRGKALVGGFGDCAHALGAGERGVLLGEATRADKQCEERARVEVGWRGPMRLERVLQSLGGHAVFADSVAPLGLELVEIDVFGLLGAGGECCDLAGAPGVAAERREVRFDVLAAG